MNPPTKTVTALVLAGALAGIAAPRVASAQSAAAATARLTINSPWGPEAVVLVPDAPAPRRYLCATPCTLRVAPGPIRLALSGTRVVTFYVPPEGASVVATAQTEASHARAEAERARFYAARLSLSPARRHNTGRNVAIGVGVGLGATLLAGAIVLLVTTAANTAITVRSPFAGFGGP